MMMCPICGVAMLVTKLRSDSKHLDIFHCLRYETIIVCWVPEATGAATNGVLSARVCLHQGSILCPHSRQCVGRTSTRSLVPALTQPLSTRRHGNTRACGPSLVMTASSRSRSNGAEDIGSHMTVLSRRLRLLTLIYITPAFCAAISPFNTSWPQVCFLDADQGCAGHPGHE